MSESGREFTYKAEPGGLSATDPTGLKYDARFDGKRYPVTCADGYDQVLIRKVDARTLEEKFWFKGKPVLTNRMTLGADGKELTIAWSVPGESGTDVARGK